MNEQLTGKPVRFLMVGGFLGAGKTTTIGKLAAHYVAQGKNVALVTNDQAYNLVDTETLRRQGFHVGEVPGACFCCKFDDLLSTVDSLSEDSVPDLIIAEPVGSCTDLVATVIEPMKSLFGDRFETGPLVVLLKPSHGKKILADGARRGFSPKAEYIFLKQLEEADSIAINKIDRMSEDEQQELLSLTKERFPEKNVFLLSARDGIGFEDLVSAIESDPISRTGMMEMDYEVYAEGEAELGWLNCQVQAATGKDDEKFSLDEVVLAFVRNIGAQLAESGAEVAHLKVLGQTLENSAIANMVSSDGIAELSLPSEINAAAAELLVNARVATAPETLAEIVNSVAEELQSSMQVKFSIGQMQSFRPGKPEPTHRMV
ncbi:GTP-binding protein [Mariniblastus fucicola]|uniref:Metal chaperone YciC n=1 Tax=Mariniblastus fucicola TaxID=980251 RepID=A0A5B9PFP0_9BACT|nr:GTP-binding protein [Mariniblastus fucicola]QEG23446.1 Putative metal chaperone YciC [Mariniblastus fucicola]